MASAIWPSLLLKPIPLDLATTTLYFPSTTISPCARRRLRRMTIIATDILGDLCGLSLGLIVAIIPIGLLLWLLGWWSHRFWIVLATTVLAGVFGLLEASSWRVQ